MKKIPGFTPKQRQWFLKRDRNRCSMLIFDIYTGKFSRCMCSANIQVHHIIPRGFITAHFTKDEHIVNSPENGICLCPKHHISKGATSDDLLYVVHSDMFGLYEKYQKGDTNAFSDIFIKRHAINMAGIPYWNTTHDWLFLAIVKRRNATMEEEFPYRGKRTPPIVEGMAF